MQFNYRVSHDLLAPLKTVRGFIGLCDDELSEGNLDEVRSYHEIVSQNITRLETLVEDVLNLARADIRSVERVDIELSELVAEIIDKFRTTIEAARQGNIELFRTVAHAFRGSAGIIGATRLHYRLAALEVPLDTEQLTPPVREVRRDLEDTLVTLDQWLAAEVVKRA